MGTHGEYSDRMEYPINYVETEAEAKKLVSFLESQAKLLKAKILEDDLDLWDWDFKDELKDKYPWVHHKDVRISSIYPTTYYIMPVEKYETNY